MAFLGLFGKPKQRPFTESELYDMEEAAADKSCAVKDDKMGPIRINSPLNVIIAKDGKVYGLLVDIITMLKKHPKIDADGVLYYMEESLKHVIRTNHNFKGKS